MNNSYCAGCCGDCSGITKTISKENKIKMLELEEKTLEQQLAIVREAKESVGKQSTDEKAEE